MVNSLNDGLSKPDLIAEGRSIQAGSFTASAATTTVVFDPAFANTPVMNLTLAVSGATTSSLSVNAVSTGSVTFLSTSGLSYNWTAHDL